MPTVHEHQPYIEIVQSTEQLGSDWSRLNGADPKGGDPEHWPADLCVRDYPRRRP